jgi:hypothetical protein
VLGFNQSVSLSCTENIPAAACTIGPSLVSLAGSGATSVTVQVSTTGTPWSPASLLPSSRRGARYQLAWLALLVPGVLWRSRRGPSARTRGGAALAFGGLLLLCLALAGCGGSNPVAPAPPSPTPAGTYGIVIVASSGNLTHQVNLSLTVQ